MSNKPSNPQVFPITEEIEIAGRKTTHTRAGMTLRDYFACHLMAANYANPASNPSLTEDDMARFAYEQADALLRERERE